MFNSRKVVYLGNVGRLKSIAGSEAVKVFCSSGVSFFKDIFVSNVIVTTRWWDPLVTLIKLLRPNVVTVFIADGHFSILNLNKKVNQRCGKNIFEAAYCDIYFLPDSISLDAAAEYPGLKLPYFPNYWNDPRITFTVSKKKSFDIVIIYGNDPFFDNKYCKRLLSLVNDIGEKYGNTYSIAQILPKGKNGSRLLNGINNTDNVFIGLDKGEEVLSKSTVYLCTPSTIVWQLLAISGKVAIIDIYEEDICFPSAIKRVSEVDDLLAFLNKSAESWLEELGGVCDFLGNEDALLAIDGALNDAVESSRKSSWGHLKRHTTRDIFSSVGSIISRV